MSSFPVATDTATSFAYLGWHGNGNLGDDAIYDAVRSQLPGAEFHDMPRLPQELIRASAAGHLTALRRSAQVVGGGTLIGRRHWRYLINCGMALTRHHGSYAIGAGVEDPRFTGRRSGSGRNELKRWPALLSKFQIVSVRGPQSAELLADAGLQVAVSGDPALLLPAPQTAPQDGLIGVNLGFGDDLWGHDPDRVTAEVAGAVNELAGRGYRFVGILMNSSDRKWTERALHGVDADIVFPDDCATVTADLASCSLVIASRLHAGILAALSGTPVVSLEYQPKCRDFALSIDDDASLIRTDVVTGAAVAERAEALLAQASTLRDRKKAAVGRLRQRLQADFALARAQNGLASD